MRVVVQRAKDAKCIVNQEVVGQISHGYMLLVGFTHEDSISEIQLLAKKIIGLRIFEDEMGKLNRSIIDVKGAILAISQFTLYANAKKGNQICKLHLLMLVLRQFYWIVGILSKECKHETFYI